MTEKHIGKVVQVTGPVLDIRYKEGELPALLNAIEIDINGRSALHRHEFYRWTCAWYRRSRYRKPYYRTCRR